MRATLLRSTASAATPVRPWGITKHIRDEARNLTQQGYTAFITDMYGDAKTADNPKDAGALWEFK